MVIANCSGPVTLNVGDDYSCECKGQGGNPPANVTWFKGNKPLGTGKENQILHLTNVDNSYSEIYTCEAKSHEIAKNETSIELIVNCKFNCFCKRTNFLFNFSCQCMCLYRNCFAPL